MRRTLPVVVLLLAACRPDTPAPVPLPADTAERGGPAASGVDTVAAMISAGDTALQGSVVLMVEDGRIHVAGALDYAVPGATYTIAVHERGDCAVPGPVFALPGAAELSAADASGDTELRHAIGDFGAFVADDAGQARFTNSKRSPVGAVAFAGRTAVVRRDGGAAAGCGVLRPVAR